MTKGRRRKEMTRVFKVGDPVEVLDPGLAQLRGLLASFGGKSKAMPNNHGWVYEILDNDEIMVEFPIGNDDPDEHSQVAPYPAHMVRLREGKRRKTGKGA